MKIGKPEVHKSRLEMRHEVNISKTVQTIFLKFNRYLFTCFSECISRVQQKSLLQSNLVVQFYISTVRVSKIHLIHFLETIYNYSVLDVFSDKIVVYYKKIEWYSKFGMPIIGFRSGSLTEKWLKDFL